MNRGNFIKRIIYSIKHLSLIGKVVLIVAVFFVVSIPFVLSAVSPNVQKDTSPLPSKPPLPTFPDAPRVGGELIIQYIEGSEFHNLDTNRQEEIMSFFESIGVISQEKQSSVEEGPVSGFYLIKLREEIDIEEVAQKIYELPEIKGIEPNSLVTTF